ncbi:MAG: hypothetical protein LBK43_02080 [Treponema sp.]|jgi:hypothetical protein|nr:hypothetical protein [Treponema sp.]
MLLPIFLGKKYSYSYEQETDSYLLHDNSYRSYVYLQGSNAGIFKKEIARIGELPEPEYKT